MFCFVEQLCIPDCGEVAKKAEAEAVFKELLASCTSRLARTTLGVRPHEEALFDIIRGSIMNLYKRDYIKSVPTKQEMQLYEGILCTERKAVGDRGFGKINHRRLYPAAVRHYDSLFPNNHIELFDFQNEGNMEQLNEEFCALIHDANTNERNLSGGNQQKVVIAKWFASKARIIVLDEPTRGIDIGAKVEVYKLINEMVEAGIGVILLSSEVPEVFGMADRILVLKDGQITGEYGMDEINKINETDLQRLVM